MFNLLGWPLKPFEKCQYIGSLIKAIRENIKYPRGLPSLDGCKNRSVSVEDSELRDHASVFTGWLSVEYGSMDPKLEPN